MTKDTGAFLTQANETLEALMDMLDEAVGDQADVDLQDGILTIELDAGGTFIINKHEPNRQIWLSSPVSGASHYDFDTTKNGWVNTRDGTLLNDVITADFAKTAGVSLLFA